MIAVMRSPYDCTAFALAAGQPPTVCASRISGDESLLGSGMALMAASRSRLMFCVPRGNQVAAKSCRSEAGMQTGADNCSGGRRPDNGVTVIQQHILVNGLAVAAKIVTKQFSPVYLCGISLKIFRVAAWNILGDLF